MRFVYDSVNEPLPAADFAMPQPEGISPVPPAALDADYTRRFVTLSDGSDGNIKVRFGKKGPKGTADEGFVMDGY